MVSGLPVFSTEQTPPNPHWPVYQPDDGVLSDGLWHGATWGFILWGLFNGLWIVAEQATKPQRQTFFRRFWPDMNAPLHRFLSTLLVFHAGALMGIFLRAPSINAAWSFITGLFYGSHWQLNAISSLKPFLPVVLGLLLMDFVNRRMKGRELPELLASYGGFPRWSFYLALCILILTFGRIGDTPFFYYQF
jgi:alginate O-acetyltransferase complex protein AlgI